MATLTKEQILKADDLKTETVEVPEWGGPVNIRTLTGAERDAFEQTMVNLIFDDNDVIELGKKSGSALDRVFAVAQKLNGFGDKDIEDLGKNLSKGQSGDSISA
jgi:hypothetical protein